MNFSNINGKACIEIEPILVKYNDPAESTYLAICILYDDLISNATIGWELLMNTNEGWQASSSGQFYVNVQEYTDWDGSNTYIFEHILPALSLIAKE